jgi:hypothetical protein
MDKKTQELLDKKLTLDLDLKNLEKLIFDLETKYLEETANTGNRLLKHRSQAIFSKGGKAT